MCVNDLVVQGADRCFSSTITQPENWMLIPLQRDQRYRGRMSAIGLFTGGWRTAEMPGMYHGEDYDVAGFCVAW